MIYDYQCKECGHEFEKNVKMADREKAINEPCPNCGELKVVQKIGVPMYVDDRKLMGQNHRLPTQFKEVLSKIHSRTPGSKLNDNFGFKL